MMTSPMEWNFFVLHDRGNIKFVFGQMGNRIKTDFGLEYVPSALVVKKKTGKAKRIGSQNLSSSVTARVK